jgi:hypothetical protein
METTFSRAPRGTKFRCKEKRLKEFTALAAVVLERLLSMSTFDSTTREKDAPFPQFLTLRPFNSDVTELFVAPGEIRAFHYEPEHGLTHVYFYNDLQVGYLRVPTAHGILVDQPIEEIHAMLRGEPGPVA